jgi:hydrogenase maturation protease
MSPSVQEASTVVLGCGNILYGDDAFGSLVVDALGTHKTLGKDVALIDAGTGGPRLVNLLNGREFPPKLIIVDTAMQGKEPGTVTVLHSHDMPDEPLGRLTHSLKLAEEIRTYRGECYLVLCEPKRLEHGASPSRHMRDAIPDACSWVEALVKGEFP